MIRLSVFHNSVKGRSYGARPVIKINFIFRTNENLKIIFLKVILILNFLKKCEHLKN